MQSNIKINSINLFASIKINLNKYELRKKFNIKINNVKSTYFFHNEKEVVCHEMIQT